jgi:hypothetical protein
MRKTETKIAEALFEIINGLHGARDKEHTQWEREAKQYLKELTAEKNITLEDTKITIENEDGTKVLYTIIIK